jgi:hypothetical protein
VPAIATTALADWIQRFEENGVGDFTKMEAFMISGGPFAATCSGNFSQPGWTGNLVKPTYIYAIGPAVTDIQFDIAFVGSSSTPLEFDFLAWNGPTIKERDHVVWNSGSWEITLITNQGPGTYDRDPIDPVPEPATMLLLGSGLIGFAGYGRRRFLKK